MKITFNMLFWFGIWLMISGAVIALGSLGLSILIPKLGELFLEGAFIICTIGFLLVPFGVLSKTNPIQEPFWHPYNKSEVE